LLAYYTSGVAASPAKAKADGEGEAASAETKAAETEAEAEQKPKRANVIHLTQRRRDGGDADSLPKDVGTNDKTGGSSDAAANDPPPPTPPPPPPTAVDYSDVPEFMAPRGAKKTLSTDTSAADSGGGAATVGGGELSEREELQRFQAEEKEAAFTDALQHLIPVMNRLQDVFTTMDQAALRDQISDAHNNRQSSSSSSSRRGNGGGIGGAESPLQRQMRRKRARKRGGAPSSSMFSGDTLELPQIVVSD
jgi:hypothetical protein